VNHIPEDVAKRRYVDSITIDGVRQENLLQQLAKQCGRDSEKYFPMIESARGTTYGRLLHDAAACASEAGELLEIVKKIDRGSLSYDNEGVRAALEGEAVDVFIYVMNVFCDLGVDPLKAFFKKRDYNNGRFTK
jgi:NTP pyrophosphatase (non-canonical NTP hydrolase)